MTTHTIHPAPSPALHTLNTPETIHHNAHHPDSLVTSAVLVPTNEKQNYGDYVLTADDSGQTSSSATQELPLERQDADQRPK